MGWYQRRVHGITSGKFIRTCRRRRATSRCTADAFGSPSSGSSWRFGSATARGGIWVVLLISHVRTSMLMGFTVGAVGRRREGGEQERYFLAFFSDFSPSASRSFRFFFPLLVASPC